MKFRITPIIEITDSAERTFRLTHEEALELATEIMEITSPIAKIVQVDPGSAGKTFAESQRCGRWAEIPQSRPSDDGRGFIVANQDVDAMVYVLASGIHPGTNQPSCPPEPRKIEIKWPEMMQKVHPSQEEGVSDFSKGEQPEQQVAEVPSGEEGADCAKDTAKVQEAKSQSPSSPEPASATSALGPLPSIKDRIQFTKGSMFLWCEIFGYLVEGMPQSKVAEMVRRPRETVNAVATSAVRYLNHAKALTPDEKRWYVEQIAYAQEARCEHWDVDFYQDPNHLGPDDLPMIKEAEPADQSPIGYLRLGTDPSPIGYLRLGTDPSPVTSPNQDQEAKPFKIPGWGPELSARFVVTMRTYPDADFGSMLARCEQIYGRKFSDSDVADLRPYFNDIVKEAKRGSVA